jgi:hypothetical protein
MEISFKSVRYKKMPQLQKVSLFFNKRKVRKYYLAESDTIEWHVPEKGTVKYAVTIRRVEA